MRNGADRRHQPERDWQVVVAAFLRQIGRREIDGDTARRQREPRGYQRRAYPLARFGDSLVRQADDIEGDDARGDLHLDVHGADLDALKCHRGDALDHVSKCPPCLSGRVAQARMAGDYSYCKPPTISSSLPLLEGEELMSTSNAEMYARRARNADDVAEVGANVKKAIDELISVIKELESRVSSLESQIRRR